jgi:hypothetical protein
MSKMVSKTVTTMNAKSGRVTAVEGDDKYAGLLRLTTDNNTMLTTAEARELGKWLIEWSGTEALRTNDTTAQAARIEARRLVEAEMIRRAQNGTGVRNWRV